MAALESGVTLSESQINDLARPLSGILEVFFQDPKNEEGFQKWLRNVEAQKPVITNAQNSAHM